MEVYHTFVAVLHGKVFQSEVVIRSVLGVECISAAEDGAVAAGLVGLCPCF